MNNSNQYRPNIDLKYSDKRITGRLLEILHEDDEIINLSLVRLIPQEIDKFRKHVAEYESKLRSRKISDPERKEYTQLLMQMATSGFIPYWHLVFDQEVREDPDLVYLGPSQLASTLKDPPIFSGKLEAVDLKNFNGDGKIKKAMQTISSFRNRGGYNVDQVKATLKPYGGNEIDFLAGWDIKSGIGRIKVVGEISDLLSKRIGVSDELVLKVS